MMSLLDKPFINFDNNVLLTQRSTPNLQPDQHYITLKVVQLPLVLHGLFFPTCSNLLPTYVEEEKRRILLWNQKRLISIFCSAVKA